MPTTGAIPPRVIENGGLHVTFRAHAVCGNCTHFEDFHGDPEALTLEQFGDKAGVFFGRLGWKLLTSGKLADKFCCPTCAKNKA